MKRLVGLLVLALGVSGCQTLRPSEAGRWANPDRLSLAMVDTNLTEDALAGALVALSDQRCEDYLVGVTIQRNTGSSGLAVLADALTTVGGLASQARTANAFAASGLFASNTSRTLSANIFAGRDFSIIYDAVKRGRSAEREALLSANYTGQSPHEVLARIVPYDLNCGISYGLSQISTAVAQAAPADN